MDPLSAVSLAAAVLQFVDFGTKVTSRLYEFKKSTGEIPESLRSVSDQLPLLVQSLQRTEAHQILDKDEKTSLKHVVDGCSAQVHALQKILDKILPSKDDSTWRRARKALSSLNKDSDLQRINSKLAEYIRTLTYFHVAATPDISNLHIQQADLEQERDRARPAFLVNFDKDPYFIGRDNVLQDIFTHFESAEPAQHRIAIHGMAGVGKSKIAIECCYNFRDRHPDAHVFWIHAGSLVRFNQSYKEIAQALNLMTPNSPNVNVLALVRNWFNETTTAWLAIYDNADDMDTLFAPKISIDRGDTQTPRLSDYLPRANVGSVIVTTRDRRVADMLTSAATATTIQITEFELPVAQAFLQSRLGSDSSKNAQEELVQALDCLPLAISQAAAFISQNAISPIEYLELLRPGEAETKELLAMESYDLSRDPEIKNSIIQTWMLSFVRIQEQNREAARILSLMAVLDRQSVPSFLLRKEGDSKIQFMTAIGTLKAFSLIAEETQSSTYSMHRVVHLATQSWLETHGTLAAVRHEALEFVSEDVDVDLDRFPWAPSNNVLPHARLVAAYERAEETSSCHAKLLSGLASYESRQGDLGSAHTAALEAIEIYRSIGESQSIAFLGSGSVLVHILLLRQDFQEAEALSCELLSIGTKIGRMSYPIACQHAQSLVFQKRYNEAEQLFWKTLDHANSLNDSEVDGRLLLYVQLAWALMKSNKFSGAEDIVNQGLKVAKESPDESIAIHRHRLREAMAEMHRGQGRWQEAVESYREVLRFREDYAGQADRYTLLCRKDMGYCLMRTGHFDEGYATVYVGFNLAVRNIGASDNSSLNFTVIMVIASLAQDDMVEIAANGENTQSIGSIVEKWGDFIAEEIYPSLETAFARDTSPEQAEFHLGEGFETCRAELGLERERTPHLNKAHNDIRDTLRKHKSPQRS